MMEGKSKDMLILLQLTTPMRSDGHYYLHYQLYKLTRVG